MKPLDPTALMLLVDILDSGTLSETARKLKMSRANVSHRLMQLERSAGAQLIRRTTRRAQPTELGLRLYDHACRIRNELLAAKEALATLEQTLQGRVRLSVPTGYGEMVMSPWLIEFKKMHPAIILDITFENRVRDLLREEIDIAVRVMSEPPEMLVARALGPVRYVACASRPYEMAHGMPKSLEELAAAPLITSGVVGRQLRLSAYLDDERQELALQPTLISEHFPFLRSAVLGGIGIGLVPDYVVRSDIEKGTIVTALDDWRLSIFGTHMFMLYMQNRYQTRSASTLIDFIIERARSELAPDRSQHRRSEKKPAKAPSRRAASAKPVKRLGQSASRA
jgi:DNA-binding transcriptional LysR family regulator